MSTTNDSAQVPSMVSASSTISGTTNPGSDFTSIMGEGVTHIDAPSDGNSITTLLDTTVLDSILTRPRLISNITINGSEVWNTNILGTSFDPFRLFCTDTLIGNLLSPYSAIRADMQVTIVVKPPGSCMGSMVFTAICDGGFHDFSDADTYTNDNVFTAFSDTYGVVAFEKANDLVFDLPFVYPKDYFDYRTGFSLYSWRLAAYTLTPLQSMISTSAVANIKIYANFKKGYKLCNAFFQSGKNDASLSGFKKKGKELRDRAASKVLSATGGHKISDLTSTAASIATTIGTAVPFIAPFAAPIAVGLSAISEVASWFGFTREALVYHPQPVVPRLMSSYSAVDGIDTSERLVLRSDAVLSIDPAIGDGSREDILAFESLRRRWSLISSFDLTTSTVVGKVFELPVSPSYGGVYLGLVYMSPAGYYGLPFQYWRGGMEYMIYVPSSTSMRGGLQILWSPAVTNSATLVAYSGDPTNRLNNVVLDLNETQQHIVQVPYSSTHMLMQNEILGDGKYFGRTEACCNGSLTFYLTSPYVAPRVGLISTKVLILARPMADMRFAEPRCSINDNGLTAAICLQSGGNEDAIDEQNELFTTSILSIPIDDHFDMSRELTSEVAPSARALMQKFAEILVVQDCDVSLLFTLPPFCQATTQFPWYTKCLATQRDNSSVASWSWATHYSMMYVGWRGGVRIKVTQVQSYAANVLGVNTAAYYPAAPQVIFASTSTVDDAEQVVIDQQQQCWDNTVGFRSRPVHALVQTVSLDKAGEFAFPYCSENKYSCSRNTQVGFPPSSNENENGNKAINIRGFMRLTAAAPSLANFVTYRIGYAAAEDVSVTRFKRVPGLIAAYLITAT